MTPRPILIGTRGSALALAQASLVASAVANEGRPHRIVVIETEGDRRAPDTTWGEGAFVAAIERALLEGRVDVAVHSAKDVPTDEDERLRIGAYLARADPRDALVARAGSPVAGLADLPPGSIVGTDSPRRTAFVRALRPDVVVRPLHGNVDTRLRRLDEGEVDVLVLAVAGLVRLGRSDRISAILDPSDVPPAPGQGAIAVQIRADDAPLIAFTATIDDRPTRVAVETERAFLRATGGGCRSPIGALARTTDGATIRLLAGRGDEVGRSAIEAIDLPLGEVGSAVVELAGRLAVALRGEAFAAHSMPTVLVTRPVRGGDSLVGALVRAGLGSIVLPAIATRPVEADASLDAAVAALPDHEWVVVTSAMGVRALEAPARRVGIDLRAIRWAAVGPATARALTIAGADRSWQPSHADAETLARELPLQPRARIAHVRGRLAGDQLASLLRARGAAVDEVVVYDTIEAPESSIPLVAAALGRRPAAVVLASPSAARGLLALTATATEAGDGRAGVLAIPAVCIGERTATTARQLGYAVAATADVPDPDVVASLVAGIALAGATS
ncbi:MAG TPA: hydroxymethylbilane synthase [Candidatus Limnocylindrales bacterium]|nr:hydroxymethylbilane synthase [Candidatus Limnocylindrales bacterium]